jgi:hypothetical protein
MKKVPNLQYFAAIRCDQDLMKSSGTCCILSMVLPPVGAGGGDGGGCGHESSPALITSISFTVKSRIVIFQFHNRQQDYWHQNHMCKYCTRSMICVVL